MTIFDGFGHFRFRPKLFQHFRFRFRFRPQICPKTPKFKWGQFNFKPISQSLTDDGYWTDVPSLDTELDNYLREPHIPRSANIYAYWHTSQFPGLEPAARKYLSAAPTSVASEQLFSAAGQIYSDRRSSLLWERTPRNCCFYRIIFDCLITITDRTPIVWTEYCD